MSAVAPPPALELARVRGADAARLGRLHAVSLALGPGIHLFVGRPEDGTLALAELVAGRSRPAGGHVRIHGREPARSARLRARIGSMLAAPELVPAATVERVIAWVAEARGQRPELLARLGLGALAPRRLASLRRDEARAVELALALGHPDPLALVLHEPFRDVAAIDFAQLRRELSERANAGAVVVVTADSADDLAPLATAVHRLERGRLPAAERGSTWPPQGEAEVSVWLDGVDREAARRLAAELAGCAELSAVGWRQQDDDGALVVTARGADLDRVALAVAAATRATGTRVVAVHSEAVDGGASA